MKKISLDAETLCVESFETASADSGANGTVRGFWTDASARPCSRCCPETRVEPVDDVE